MLLDLFEFAHLLQSAQGIDAWIQNPNQCEHAVFIHRQSAISGFVTLRPDVFQAFQLGGDLSELAQARNFRSVKPDCVCFGA
jgi:hypothetical protein